MTNSNAAVRPGLIGICCILTLLATALPILGGAVAAAEKPVEQLFLKFHLHSFVMRVATLKFEFDITPKTYSVRSTMKTKGLADFIKDAEFNAAAKGVFKKSGPLPVQFDITTDNSRTGNRNQIIQWNGKRLPAVSRSWQIGDFKTNALEKAIKPGMPDPLTALLTAAFRSSETLCQDQFRVINGKTVFDMHYSYVGPASFDADTPGVYRGKAHKCQVLYRPVAGLSQKKWAKLKAKPNQGVDRFTIWMAPVQASRLGRVLYVPVGGVATVDGREIRAHLVAAALSGKALNEQSRMVQK